MSNIKKQLIKLGSNHPDLQKNLRPVINYLDEDDKLSTWLDKASKKASSLKIARNLTTIGKFIGFEKIAFLLDKHKINDVVKKQLKKDGLDEDEIPDINWGGIFMGTANNVKRKMQIPEHKFEELVSGVLEDMVMGYNSDTGNSIRSLSEQVRRWHEQGKDARDMRNLLGKQVADKMRTKFRYTINKVRRSPTDENIPTKDIKQRGRQEDSPKDTGAGQVFEETMQLDESVPIAQNWMETDIMDPQEIAEKVEDREELKEGLEKLVDGLGDELKDDPGSYVIWQGYKQNQGVNKLSDILDEEISYTNPETGEVYTETVADAVERFGTDPDSNSIYYLQRKLRDAIENVWDDVSKWL